MKYILILISSVGILSATTNNMQKNNKIDNTSILESEPSKEASTVGKWIVEDDYIQPDELEEFEWSGIEWGVSSNEENN